MKPQSISPTSAEVSQPHSQHHVGQQQDSFGNRTAHIADHSLDGQLPTRSWGDVFRETSRKIGFGTAMMGAGLGLTGLGGIERREAEAGIVISSDPNADQRARDNGFGYSVEGGGNVAAIRVVTPTGIGHSSVVFLDSTTALFTAHQATSLLDLENGYSIRTGANYETGASLKLAQLFIHPLYGGIPGTGIDLAIGKLAVPVPGVNRLEFATGTPSAFETVWLAGYGRPGNRNIGELPQDGFIRAGTSFVSTSPPLLGNALDGYQDLLFQDAPNKPTAMRGSSGDSGGGVFDSNGHLYGIIVGGSNTINGSVTTFISINAAEPVRSFIETHRSTVPEPSSGLLAAGAALATLLSRVRRNS